MSTTSSLTTVWPPPDGRKPYNIYVDNTSLTSTVLDYNLYWLNSGTLQINWNGTGYSSVTAFHTAVTAQEANGKQGNPLFVAPHGAATDPPSVGTGDYHLSASSAAIDNANSAAANWPSTDLDGLARVDDPATANTGAGTRLYDDRGAYEFHPGGATTPVVTTQAVTSITATTATGNGNITALGATNPTQHGVAWNTSANPTTANSHTSDGAVSATGPFTSAITGLTAGTTYHVRAYATNGSGTAYGGDVSFTTTSATSVTFNTSGSWVAPTGVTSVTVEVWGGGGKGGDASGSGEQEGGGGGGGAYSIKNSIAVTPGNSYSYVVGAGATGSSAGGNSYFINTSTVLAKGGNSVATNSTGGVSGGSSGSGVGDTKFSGGSGANASSGSNYGGGGGSSAGTAANGGNASNSTGGTAPTGGGSGGNGKSSSQGNGTAGTAPGGAGGGAYRSNPGGSNGTGGNGAAGQVRLTFTVVPVSTTTVVNCGAGTPVITYGGTAITCVATVTRSSGSLTPSGTVSWVTGGAGTFVTSPCTLAGSGASATCSVTYSPTSVGTGSHLITATYSGDVSYLTSNGNQSVTVNAAAVAPVITASSKVYDGTLTAAILTRNLTGIIGTDVVTLTGGTAAFATKDVGVGKIVTGTGFTLSGAQAGNYQVAPVSATTTADVTVKALTMSGLTVPASKIYDGTTAAVVGGAPVLAAAETAGTGTAIDGKPYSGDTVSIVGPAVGTYNSKDVGTAANVVFSGLTLGGAQASDYSLTIQGQAAATITVKALTMSGLSVPASKVYDGSTAAVVTGTPALALAEAPAPATGLDGKPYTGDIVSILGTAVGTYNSKDVATAANVSFSGLSLTGGQAPNYSLTIQSPALSTITIKALTMSGLSVPASKAYDGSTGAIVTGTPALQAAEAVGSGTAVDGKPYTGDSVNITGSAVGTYNSKNVATAANVTFSGLILGGGQATNYSLTIQSPASATITAKALILTGLAANNKVYDRSTTASLLGTPALFGVVSPDVVTLGGAPLASFADKTVANNKPVTVSGYTIGGADVANYTLTQPAGLMANITAKPLTITGLTANNKVYDRLATATLSGTADIPGVISGDAVTLGGAPSASFADKTVANNKPVTVSGYTIGGALTRLTTH